MLNFPWIVTSDFNAIFFPNEHRRGNFFNYVAKPRSFSDFVFRNNLLDLGFVGPEFSWCNGQSGLARRWARLERFLANCSWISNFDSYCNQHLPRIQSNHAPLFLNAQFHINHRSHIFRFENYWLELHNCHYIIHRAWNCRTSTSPLHSLLHLIARTRSHLLNWRTLGLTSLDIDIRNNEADISYIEAVEVCDNSINNSDLALKILYNRHIALLNLNSICWAQRARLMWLKNSDLNTSFFPQACFH